MEACFYVYEHIRHDTGAVFYVGKGKGERAWDEQKRNPYWRRVVSRHGYDARIVVAGLDEELALLAEVELIDKQTRLGARLTNLTAGGEGGCTTTGDAEARRVALISKSMVARWQGDHRERMQRRVKCLDTDQVFESLTQACAWLAQHGHPKAAQAAIYYACTGQRQKAYGFRWAYADRTH